MKRIQIFMREPFVIFITCGKTIFRKAKKKLNNNNENNKNGEVSTPVPHTPLGWD